MFYSNKLRNPILWTRTSEALYQTIRKFVLPSDRIIEVGSGTGHISYLLAREGNKITLNDIRFECLKESQAIFDKHGVKCQVEPGSLFTLTKHYDFLWNSGLIQCLQGTTRRKFVKKIAELAHRVILFYPDIDDAVKLRGKNTKIVPGVDDAAEYPIGDIPETMNRHFRKVVMGELTGAQIGLPYKMYYVYGDNSK